MYIEHGTGAFDTSACTHVGAAFRPIADSELDAGAITVKSALGYCDGDLRKRGGTLVAPKNPDLAHAA